MNFNKILKSLFGDKSTRDMKLIQPLVEKVKEAYPAIKALSNDELRAKTKEIQKYVQDAALTEKEQIAKLRATIEETPIDEREKIFNKRMEIYNYYHKSLAHLADEGKIEQPYVPAECSHNAHMYYIKVHDIQVRTRLISYLREKGICSVFHYVPLHSAPAGQKFGRFSGEDVYTTRESERLLRLPLFYNLDMEDVKYITDTIASFDGF